MRRSVVKQLRHGMAVSVLAVRELLHQYPTLSRCDLCVADKAILIEGTSERLLLPSMLRKTDEAAAGQPQLSSQYLTVMEVGGAYAQRFYDLLNFLELRTRIITDIDSVAPNASNKRVAVPVAQGTFTSNPCIKEWFSHDVSPAPLLSQTADEKLRA